MSPYDPFLKQMYEEKLRQSQEPQMSNTQKIAEMCRRVGLPMKTGSEIYYMALNCAVKLGRPRADMVLVAKAIKYAADNKRDLKPQWRIQ